MKFRFCHSIVAITFFTSTLQCAILYTSPPVAKAAAKIAPNPATPALNAPYIQELQAAKISPALLNAWQNLYEQFLQAQNANPSTSPNATPSVASAIAKGDGGSIFSTNFFTMMADYLNPKTFPQFTNDPQGQIHWNYATKHLRAAVTRLASVASITQTAGTPTVDFKGDCRDLGILVNVQNNTDAQFSINQVSLDGSSTIQIGQLDPGLNELNLHTAALQKPISAKNSKTTQSTIPSPKPEEAASEDGSFFFQFKELNVSNPTTIALQLCSGTDLVTFLESLPRKDKKVVEMNGLPTSPEYLANPTDWYLVLIQNPPAAGATAPNPDQRIQAINISKLAGPYLLTMQLNQETVTITKATANTPATTMDIFQPSLTTALTLKNKFTPTTNLPLIILPQFLWQLPKAQAIWMLLNSAYIAALTNFKFFGTNTFGNAFEYFNNLGCFDMNNKCAFFIDLYNIIPIGNSLYDSPWLIASALYVTPLSTCSDIAKIHSSQDSYGHIFANVPISQHINFQAMCNPRTNQTVDKALFNQQYFNSIYALPGYQLFTLFSSALTTDIRDGIFGTLTETKQGTYQLTWTNKQNSIIDSQYLYLNAPLAHMQITFINRSTNWVGSSVPTQLIELTPSVSTHFKVTYEYNSSNNKNILLAQSTSPIDKQEGILPLYFTKYPLTNLYLDAYKTFNVQPYTQCCIIKDGVLPLPLESLTAADWKTGVYIIPYMHNAQTLAIAFYKSDKTLLGEITTPIQTAASTTINPQEEPINAYNLRSPDFHPMVFLYLSTGILLQYNQTK